MATKPAEPQSNPLPSGSSTAPNSSDIERQQEEQLRAKYPTMGLKGSAILQKKMQSKVKYFDSGDYNMALSKQMALAKAKHGAGPESSANAPVAPTTTGTEGESSATTHETSAPTLSGQPANPEAVSDVTSGGDDPVACNCPAKETGGACSEAPQHHSPPVAVLLTATPAVAQELLQQQVNHGSDEEIPGPGPKSSMRMARSESIREVTGETMATPDNVTAIARKKSLLNQHGRPALSSSPPTAH